MYLEEAYSEGSEVMIFENTCSWKSYGSELYDSQVCQLLAGCLAKAMPPRYQW